MTYIGSSSEWGESDWNKMDSIKSKTKYCNSKVRDYTIVEYNDASATSVNLPEFATYLEGNSLPTTLKYVSLPKALTDFDRGVFDYLTNLTSINVQSGSTKYTSSGGVLFSGSGTVLERYPVGKTATSYVIPSTVKTLGDSAFYNCKNLKELTIPASVTRVDDYALSGGMKLTTLTIKCKNPATMSSRPVGSSTFTTVDYGGTRAEWDASSWKTALDGRYTTLKLASSITITQQP